MAKLGRALLALLRSYFIGVGVLTTMFFLVLMISLSRCELRTGLPRVSAPEGDAVLVIDLSGHLRRWRSGRFDSLLSGVGLRLRYTWISDMRRVLALARDDPHIKAVLLDLQENLHGTLVDFAVLRELLVDFVTTSDKEVVCFLAAGDGNNYFLASAADRIVISPVTMLEIPGPVLHLTYFGRALKKLGVGVQVVQTGDYKSAFEPFVRNQPSPATLEMYRNLEQSLRHYLVSTIAAGRQRDAREVSAWLTRSIFSPSTAQTHGVIDALGHRNDVLAALKEKAQVEEHIAYQSYLATAATESAASDGGLGLVEAVGPIFMDGNAWDTLLPRRIIAELEWMAENEDVSAVVLRVNSPGGSAVASELIWKEVTRLATRKPVVVSMGEVAASGGYYLAAGASYMLAEPATITGSIGVVGMLPNFAGFEDKYGISFHTVTASERRALYNTGKAMTDADQSLVQHNLREIYRVFKERVAAGRKLDMAKLEQLAGGRVFTGRQAVEVGLVDALGDLTAAFTKAKELAALDPSLKYPLYRYDHGRLSFFDCLRATFDIERCLKTQYSRSSFNTDSLHNYLRLLTSNKMLVLALWPHYVSD